jgi:hypothetical protein
MAESYGDSEKDKFVVAFGESDGGHSFVTLSDAIDAEHIKSVQPQDDVWGAIDALRNGSAQIAVIPFSNKITSAEAATVAGLASGDLKILGQIQRRTNHVMVGLKHNIRRVYQAAKDARYTDDASSGSDGNSSTLGSSGAGGEPSDDAVRQFVFLLHMVYSSKTVFDQTRGKLTSSDFRSAIRVEHTSNPMRVLLRDHRNRKTQAIVSTLENSTPRSTGAAAPGYQAIQLTPPATVEKQIEENFFSAALVAEGLLSSANHVCRVGPDLKPNKLCSQRLSEMNEYLVELKTDAEAPLDLPNNVTTFLVVQAANAKLGGKDKKGVPWAKTSARLSEMLNALAEDTRAAESRVARFSAAIESAKKQLEGATDPLHAVDLKEQISRLEGEYSSSSKQLASLRESKVKSEQPTSGPDPEHASYRIALLLAVDSSDSDWAKSFKLFEAKMEKHFKWLKLKFDQSPELATHLGKQVLLVSARAGAATSKNAAKIEADLNNFFRREKEQASKIAASLSVLADQRAGSAVKFEPKLLGIYPSWSVTGPDRNTWLPEDGKSKPDNDFAALKTLNVMGILLFVTFWMLVIFLVTVTSTPYGRSWVMGLMDGLMQYFKTLFFGPG